MTLRDRIKVSFFNSFFRKIWQGYCFLEERLYSFSKESWTCILINKFWRGFKINLDYSSLGGLSRINHQQRQVLENSRSVKWLLNAYRQFSSIISSYAQASTLGGALGELKNIWFISALRLGSLMLITLVFIDTLSCLFFRNTISLYGYILRLLMVLAGLAGIHSDVNWGSLKETSFFLNLGGNSPCKSRN